jgi:hypothetical protein
MSFLPPFSILCNLFSTRRTNFNKEFYSNKFMSDHLKQMDCPCCGASFSSLGDYLSHNCGNCEDSSCTRMDIFNEPQPKKNQKKISNVHVVDHHINN